MQICVWTERKTSLGTRCSDKLDKPGLHGWKQGCNNFKLSSFRTQFLKILVWTDAKYFVTLGIHSNKVTFQVMTRNDFVTFRGSECY